MHKIMGVPQDSKDPSPQTSDRQLLEMDAKNGFSSDGRKRRYEPRYLFSYQRPAKGGYMKYRVSLEKTEEGYSVWVPGLPGCWSQGKTEKEALENITDAIEGYLEVVDKLTANKEVRYVEVANA